MSAARASMYRCFAIALVLITASPLLARSAKAAIIDIGPAVLTSLVSGNVYTHAPTAAEVVVGGHPFSFDYIFDVPAAVVTSLLATEHPTIANLTFSWLDSGGSPLAGGTLNGEGTLAFAVPAGDGVLGTLDFILRVTGIASGLGRYDFDLTAGTPRRGQETPLPGAAWLFMAGLLGLYALSWRRTYR